MSQTLDENHLLYADSHEWAAIEHGVCTVGISRFACEELTDITYIELPAVGKHVEKGKTFGVIESVKSANDLYAPVSGEVVAVNLAVANDPAGIAADPYGKGWMVKLKTTATPATAGLKNKAQYDAQVAAESH